ncbi:transposase [Humibacillus xanthopallidus]|uniref:transposase n=1 Tax=Humibacillus xanthopallidus TaxID=412689 RepID=UPI00384B04D9
MSRFPDRSHFASWTGTAPIDASSGEHVRHRLSRGGNRKFNLVLHIMATVQLRTATVGRAYFDRKIRALRVLLRRHPRRLRPQGPFRSQPVGMPWSLR